MSEESPRKFPWLRLQPLRMSPWLLAWILFEFLAVLLPPICFEWTRNGHDWAKAFLAAGQQRARGVLTPLDIALAGLLTPPFIWFTYFSNNKRVRDSDKFAVFLMFCGAGLGLIVMILRYISRFY